MKLEREFYILIFFGIAFTFTLYSSYHYDNILSIILFIIFGAFIIYHFYNNLFDENGSYKTINELKKSAPFVFGTLIIISNLAIYSFYEFKINAETLLKAENHGVYADFKKNGEYIIKSGSWGSKKRFYGKYILKDNLIIVDRKYFDEVLTTDKFLIRKIENAFDQNDNGKIKTYLVKLNKNEKELDNDYLFEIVEDNRK